jgi:hypothetical protein
MKTLQFAIILCGCSFLMFSCSKDPVDAATTPDDNKISTTPADNKCDYSPYSPGTTFTYELATKDFNEQWKYAEFRGNVSGYKTIGTKKYSVGTGLFPQDSSRTPKEGYIRCDATGMYVLAQGFNNGQDMELNLIQYPVAKNKTWKSAAISQTVQGATIKYQYIYKILNTGLVKKIKTNTFNNVIELDESLVTTLTESGVTDTVSVTTLKRFYDKQVGHIQTAYLAENFFSGRIDTVFIQSIVSYSVK